MFKMRLQRRSTEHYPRCRLRWCRDTECIAVFHSLTSSQWTRSIAILSARLGSVDFGGFIAFRLSTDSLSLFQWRWVNGVINGRWTATDSIDIAQGIDSRDSKDGISSIRNFGSFTLKFQDFRHWTRCIVTMKMKRYFGRCELKRMWRCKSFIIIHRQQINEWWRRSKCKESGHQ